MATRLAIREKQLATWTAIIQECRNSGMKGSVLLLVQAAETGGVHAGIRFSTRIAS